MISRYLLNRFHFKKISCYINRSIIMDSFMSGSAGTDLNSAYSNDSFAPTSGNFTKEQPAASTPPVQYSPEIPKDDASPRKEVNTVEQAPIYNQSDLLQDINNNDLKAQMNTLRKEIQQQRNVNKLEYKDNYERNSLYDRFMKRKADVYRFVCLSMIIVFALATHELASKTLSEYINSINVTPKRAFAMQISYPILILLIYWTFKSI